MKMSVDDPVHNDVERFFRLMRTHRAHALSEHDLVRDIFMDIDPVDDKEILELVSGFVEAPAVVFDGYFSTARIESFATSRAALDFLRKERDNNNRIYLYVFMSKYDKLIMRYHRVPK